jgi:hypothetical protein
MPGFLRYGDTQGDVVDSSSGGSFFVSLRIAM